VVSIISTRRRRHTLNQGLAVSGETATFFAEARIGWLARRLRRGFQPRRALDYGCGTGGSTRFLIDGLGVESVIGVDRSAASLEVARARYRELPVEYHLAGDYQPAANLDVVFCNGLFHHILPAQRSEALDYVVACVRPGGLVAFWENNPWNPGTRYVMSRVPFDRDAIPLSSLEALSLMRAGRLEVVATDFCFVFPRSLRLLRRIEPWLAWLPIGAQYLVLGRKPL
jgi:SAM-dependent methyltransferase